MNVPQADLDAIARGLMQIHTAISHGQHEARYGRHEAAAEHIEAARIQVWQLKRAAEALGAATPAGVPTRSTEPTPLHLMDTPANRRLLAALVEAHKAALEVDEERGIYDGFAEVLESFAAERRDEVFGSVGGGRE